MTTTVETVYQQHVESLSMQEKLQLIALITEQLATTPDIELLSTKQNNGESTLKNTDSERLEHHKGSPQAISQLAATLSTEEAEAMLSATNQIRSIDWEMWK